MKLDRSMLSNSLRLLPFSLLTLTVSSVHAESKIDFNRDVRPILSDNCFACHGPDKGKVKGELRLDDRLRRAEGLDVDRGREVRVG